jgi:hypothetical protein
LIDTRLLPSVCLFRLIILNAEIELCLPSSVSVSSTSAISAGVLLIEGLLLVPLPPQHSQWIGSMH